MIVHCTIIQYLFRVFSFISCMICRFSGLACRCLPFWIIGMHGRTPKTIHRFEGPSINGLGLNWSKTRKRTTFIFGMQTTHASTRLFREKRMDKGLLYVEKLKRKKEIERRDKRNARKDHTKVHMVTPGPSQYKLIQTIDFIVSSAFIRAQCHSGDARRMTKRW